MTTEPMLSFKQFCANTNPTAVHVDESTIPTFQIDKESVQTILDDAADNDWFAVNFNAITLKGELMSFIDAARLANQKGFVCVIKQGKEDN